MGKTSGRDARVQGFSGAGVGSNDDARKIVLHELESRRGGSGSGSDVGASASGLGGEGGSSSRSRDARADDSPLEDEED